MAIGVNPYEFMIGGQVPTDDQMKIMANQLRGMDSRAVLAALSGDKPLTAAGNILTDKTDKISTGLAKTRKTLEDREFTAAENKLLADATKKERDRAYERGVYEYDTTAEDTAAHRKELYRLEKAGIDATIANKAEAARIAAENKKEDNIRRLSESVVKADLHAIDADMAALDRTMRPYMDTNTGELKKSGIKGIPGAGRSRIFDSLTSDARQVNQVFSALKNKLLKARSGAAVTSNELDRIEMELGQGVWATDEDFARGIMLLKDYQEVLENHIYGGYSDDVISTFKARASSHRRTADKSAKVGASQSGSVGIVSSELVDDGEDDDG